MAAAYFGTEGCGASIDRVFGNGEPEPGAKTDNKVEVSELKTTPIFEVPDHGYMVDLSQVQGVGLVYRDDSLLHTAHGFGIDLVGRSNSKPIKWVNAEDSEKARGQAETSRKALLEAWQKYKTERA